jgi:protein SCO1/2
MLQSGLKKSTLAPHLNKLHPFIFNFKIMRPVILCAAVLCFALSACNSNTLKIYGPKLAVQKNENGKTIIDSVDYYIPPRSFIDQDSNIIDSNTLHGKIYVADFFFTSCPSICPKMMNEMGQVYEKYKNDKNVAILSYSIDPVRDSVARLKTYEEKLHFHSATWHLLTGNKDSIYNLAAKYLVSVAEDADAPGQHIHDGKFILIDKQRRIRGYYDGTNDDEVQKLKQDMDLLLQEKQ